MSMILFLPRSKWIALFILGWLALKPVLGFSLEEEAPPKEKKEIAQLLVADFEKWPNNLGGQMWVNGGGEPNWDSPVHSWLYGPEISDYRPEFVHQGQLSFRLVNALDPKNLPWANFSMDLGPTVDITVEPKKIASRDVTPYRHLVFWVRGEKGGEKFEVSFRDSSQHEVTLMPLPEGAPAAWRQVSIPLSAIARQVNLANVDVVSLNFGSSVGNPQGAVLFLDDVAFVGKLPEGIPVTVPAQVENPSFLVADFEGEVSPLGGDFGPYGGAAPNYNDRDQIHSALYLSPLPDYSLENVFRGKGSYRLVNEMPVPRRELWASLGLNLGPLPNLQEIPGRIKPADVSAYRYLIFWAKGKNGGERIKVLFRDQHVPGYLPQYFVDPYPQILTTKWQKIVVPLENVAYKVDLTKLVHIGVEFGSWIGNLKGDVLYVDDFVFTNLLSEPR